MTMMQESNQTEIDTSRIWKVGLLAVVAAIVANVLVRIILAALLDLPADFPPLQAGAIVALTAVFTTVGVVVFAVVARRAKRPIRTFHIIAAAAFVVSIIPNLISAANPAALPFPFPGATAQAFLILIIFHVVAYLVTVGILTTATRK